MPLSPEKKNWHARVCDARAHGAVETPRAQFGKVRFTSCFPAIVCENRVLVLYNIAFTFSTAGNNINRRAKLAQTVYALTLNAADMNVFRLLKKKDR